MRCLMFGISSTARYCFASAMELIFRSVIGVGDDRGGDVVVDSQAKPELATGFPMPPARIAGLGSAESSHRPGKSAPLDRSRPVSITPIAATMVPEAAPSATLDSATAAASVHQNSLPGTVPEAGRAH